MKRHQKEDLNTGKWWDEFWTSARGAWESHACPDIIWLLQALTGGKKRVLDVGCGTGRYLGFLKAEEIHGVEISPAGVAQAQKDYPQAIVTVADVVAAPIPYPDNHFDVVYCGEVIEHVEDPAKLIEELRRVCVVGGTVVVNTPYEDSIPADAHLWFFYHQDMVDLFKSFTHRSIFRFSNSGERLLWEHFLVMAIK